MFLVRSNPMRTKSQSGLNVFELMVFVLWVGCGCLVSVFLGHKFGWLGYIIGFLFGVGLGLVIYYGFIFCLAFLLNNFFLDNSSVPLCKNNTCGMGHYEIHKVKDSNGKVRFDWFCRCKERYHKKGWRFYSVLPDGVLQPYMKWRPFKKWVSDKVEK